MIINMHYVMLILYVWSYWSWVSPSNGEAPAIDVAALNQECFKNINIF